jgi:hypothetical protein
MKVFTYMFFSSWTSGTRENREQPMKELKVVHTDLLSTPVPYFSYIRLDLIYVCSTVDDMALRSRCTYIPLSLFATPVCHAVSNKYLIYFIYLIITNYFYTRTVHTAQVCKLCIWNCNRTAKKSRIARTKLYLPGLKVLSS